MNDRHSNYILDIGTLIKEKADEAKSLGDDGFHIGYRMALYEVISLMCQQAEVFDIDLKDIGLEGVDPERDYL